MDKTIKYEDFFAKTDYTRHQYRLQKQNNNNN